ncbi:hypothetical protein EII17_00210 [Clostridiales bacterium COT073_COT-073]|nr:hypothetical protein EII17_00210 [Clostridiales bacterium COT073_COT-073]
MMRFKKHMILCYLAFGLFVVVFTGCTKQENDILHQTRKVEEIIQTASSGQKITAELVREVNFSETLQTAFFEKTGLELDRNQAVQVIYGDQRAQEWLTPLKYFLSDDLSAQKNQYQDFLERQNRDLGKVTSQEKSYSKVSEKDGLAYIVVKIPFQFEKFTIAEKAYHVQNCILYRKYLWQKQDNKWQLNDVEIASEFAEKDMIELFGKEIVPDARKQTEKFLTLFGEEKAEF